MLSSANGAGGGYNQWSAVGSSNTPCGSDGEDRRCTSIERLSRPEAISQSQSGSQSAISILWAYATLRAVCCVWVRGYLLGCEEAYIGSFVHSIVLLCGHAEDRAGQRPPESSTMYQVGSRFEGTIRQVCSLQFGATARDPRILQTIVLAWRDLHDENVAMGKASTIPLCLRPSRTSDPASSPSFMDQWIQADYIHGAYPRCSRWQPDLINNEAMTATYHLDH
jgi:hypothetical protein